MWVVNGALVPDGLVARGIVGRYDDLLALLEMPAPDVEIGRRGHAVDDGARTEAQDLGIDRLEEGSTAKVRNVHDHLARV